MIPFSVFPRNLEPVTQLYVSVDASTKESLKRIDRPLFRDFWQRFLDSLKALSEKVPHYECIFKYFFLPSAPHLLKTEVEDL